MNFKKWFEDTQLALPDDPENNGLSVASYYNPDEIVDRFTGRRKKLRSKKADKMFGFNSVNKELSRK